MRSFYTKVLCHCSHCGKRFPLPFRKSQRRFCSHSCATSFRELQIRVSPEERFWAKVDRAGGPAACWPWTPPVNCQTGYGHFSLTPTRRISAHRYAWVLTHGPIPEGMSVCHDCDANYPPGDTTYRRCCNPAHLFLGTHKDNMLDAMRKGRWAFGERSGSRLHPEKRLRGEKQRAAKLNEAAVLEIRREQGKTPNKELARRFGVSLALIYQVQKGRAWAHVQPPS